MTIDIYSGTAKVNCWRGKMNLGVQGQGWNLFSAKIVIEALPEYGFLC